MPNRGRDERDLEDRSGDDTGWCRSHLTEGIALRPITSPHARRRSTCAQTHLNAGHVAPSLGGADGGPELTARTPAGSLLRSARSWMAPCPLCVLPIVPRASSLVWSQHRCRYRRPRRRPWKLPMRRRNWRGGADLSRGHQGQCGGLRASSEGEGAQADRGRSVTFPCRYWCVEYQAASRSSEALEASGCSPCRNATALCAWAAAEKIARLSSASTLSQDAR